MSLLRFQRPSLTLLGVFRAFPNTRQPLVEPHEERLRGPIREVPPA